MAKKLKDKENKKITDNTKTEDFIESGLLKGTVLSVKTQKTVTILVEGKKMHPLYKKSFAYSKRYLVHDELGVKEGDVVKVIKCHPISKNKHFKIIKVIGRDIEAIVEEELKEEAAQAIAEVMPEDKEESRVESLESSKLESQESHPKDKKSASKIRQAMKVKTEKEEAIS